MALWRSRNVIVASLTKSLAALSALLLLAGCAATPQAPRGGPFHPGAQSGEIVHSDSGFHFPARVGSFVRFAGYQYDEEGRDISVGYDGEIPALVTVYVFPAGEEDLESELVEQSAEVLVSYPGAKVTGRRKVRVTPEGIEADAVSFAFSAKFRGVSQPVHSELVLARHDDRFIKYRITYPEEIADIAGEDSQKFLEHFDWP